MHQKLSLRPTPLFPPTQDEVPVHAVLKGMCLNASKSLMWEQAADVQLEPILPFYLQNKLQEISDQSVSVRLTVMHITSPESFQIFEPLKEGNITRVFELVDARIGADAVDEEGETPLLIAVNQNMNFVISHLLNARMPRPDVNFAKASGFTALFYAINSPSEFLTNVLLRRGADPNAAVIQAGSRGNTPLHFACLQQKQKHAQLLLQYGANPYAVNEYGVQPFELLPQDASRQTKQFFKKIFEDAAEAKANAIEADYHETRKEDQEL